MDQPLHRTDLDENAKVTDVSDCAMENCAQFDFAEVGGNRSLVFSLALLRVLR